MTDQSSAAKTKTPDFDDEIVPVLHLIKAEANAVDLHAERALAEVRKLPARPEWLTKAEDALEEAEATVTQALESIRRARRHYRLQVNVGRF